LSPAGRAAPRGYRAALLLVGLLFAAPFLLVERAPLVDWPNHVARAWILAHRGEVEAWEEAFEPARVPIPNLASELVLPALFPLLGPEGAARAFLALLALLFVGGCHAAGRALHRRPTWMALPASTLLYSSTLLYGFVNYLAGAALFLLAFAAWWRARAAWSALRLAGVALLAALAWLAHLSAFAFLGAALGLVTLADLLRRRRGPGAAALDLLPLLAPAVAFVAPRAGGGGGGGIVWNDLAGKAAAAGGLAVGYGPEAPALFGLGVLALLAGLGLSRARAASGAALGLAVAFALLFLACPKVLFTSWAADARFVLPAGLLLARVATIGHAWRAIDARLEPELARLEAALPRAATVLPWPARPGALARDKEERALEHALHWLTWRRDLLVPTLFAIRGQQALVWRVDPLPGARPDALDEEAARGFARFDFAWTFGLGPEEEALLAARYPPVYASGAFALWRTR
jgi:hypothetical protein